jgi:hypothetical protein
MQGAIHGQISREQVWGMWQPFGQRGAIGGHLGNVITPEEAARVAMGADKKAQSYIYGQAADEYGELDDWFDAVRKTVADGPSQQMVELLHESNEAQLAKVRRKRAQAFEEAPAYCRTLGEAVFALAGEEHWSRGHAEQIVSRLVAPDGMPYMQYTPYTPLEYLRLGLRYEYSEPDESMTECTDFALGIIPSVRYRDSKSCVRVREHNKPHEFVHGAVVGIEAWDITREDGWRHPDATVVGHFAYKPSTEIKAGDDYSDVENLELNEGWTDRAAIALTRVCPALGKTYQAKGDAYARWGRQVTKLQAKEPEVYRAITDAALVEATTVNPWAKREALDRMCQIADRRLGVRGSLDKMFQRKVTLLDVYTKGKRS